MFKFKRYLNRPVASGNISNYFVNLLILMLSQLSKRVKMLFILLTDIGRKNKNYKIFLQI